MRLMERAIARAKLPVRFSQGFNPRPRMTLPLPRPVGVTGLDELLVMELDEPVEPDEAVERLRAMMPEGIVLKQARRLDAGRPLQPAAAEFRLPVEPTRGPALSARITELSAQAHWPWTRRSPKGPQAGKAIDLRPLVAHLDFDGRTLQFTLAPQAQAWARVEEVLALLGLDAETDRARLVRTHVRWTEPTG